MAARAAQHGETLVRRGSVTTLVQIAHELGFEATCNRDRDVLGISDALLRQLVHGERFVLVTDNASDFRPMCTRATTYNIQA